MSNIILTNVADPDITKEVQRKTFKLLRSYLEPSFGPKGSNTGIMKDENTMLYTKDGHTILKHIKLQNPIETAIRNNLEDLTTDIVKKVGDGTTSAIILSDIVYNMIEDILDDDTNPYDFNKTFKKVVEDISERILQNAQEFTPEAAYDIAMVATNGNIAVSKTIMGMYDTYGNDVFIDVGTSVNDNNIIKEYDGLVLETGYDEACYINTLDGKSHIRNPEIYMFSDPIDTRELGTFLDIIISRAMTNADNGQVIPTVVMAPKISRDMSVTMLQIADYLASQEISNRVPILVLGNVMDKSKYDDIRDLCGAKYIKKYIDPKVQEKDIERGMAPTPDTIQEFAGSADLVEADVSMTKFVNPRRMYNEDGSYSDTYKGLLEYLEAELKNLQETSTDLKDIHVLKKRIQSLKSCLVEYLIGGITPMDRDALRDLVEDAVLNCRSAAKFGYSAAANAVALWEIKLFEAELGDTENSLYKDIVSLLADAYEELQTTLLKKNLSNVSDKEIKGIIKDIVKNKTAYDVKSNKLNENIVSSIYSDVYILQAISKIITLIVTSNQFIVPDVQYNRYINKEKVK